MTVFKRDAKSSIWQYEFEINKKRYRGSTGCTSKRDAQAYEAERRKEAQEDVKLDRDGMRRMTVHEVAQKWLGVSEITHRDHSNNEHRVRKLFGDKLVYQPASKKGAERTWVIESGARYGLPKTLGIHEVTQATLLDLKDARLKEGNAAGTINRELSLVQTLMGYAQSLGAVMPSKPLVWSDRRNKAASLKMKESKGKLRWLSVDEEALLLKALKQRVKPRDQSGRDNLHLVTLLLDTGARYEEITSLKWPQVDLSQGLLRLYRSKVDNEGGLQLTKRAWAILKERRELTDGRQYVFPAHRQAGQGTTRWADEDKGRGHATEGIQKVIDECKLNDDPSLDRVTPHTFRDTFASRLVQAGVSLLKVSHLLGHANEAMTRKYAHLSPDNTSREAVSILDGLHRNNHGQGDDPIDGGNVGEGSALILEHPRLTMDRVTTLSRTVEQSAGLRAG